MNQNDCRRTVVVCLLLGLGTIALYASALAFNFVSFEDQLYVLNNPHVNQGITAGGLGWAFQAGYAGNWHPLTWLSHMLDCQFFGLRPGGHHATSVLLHAVNAVLLFLVLRRMTKAFWRSAAVAALFAWHPLHVEAVAWVADRKDVLSAFFFILVLWAWVRYVEARKGASTPGEGAGKRCSTCFYMAALAFFALGLMSKPMVVTLPCVLLLLDWWPLGRLSVGPAAAGAEAPPPVARQVLRLVMEKIPFFVLSIGSSIVTVMAGRQEAAMSMVSRLPLKVRLVTAALACFRYLAKTFWPTDLGATYPYFVVHSRWETVIVALVLGGITILAICWRKTRPYWLFGWLWFLGMLVPVIGLVQVGGQGWADRYVYLPSIGFFVIVVWSAAEWAARHPAVKLLVPVLGAALVAATSAELRHWKDTRALFGRAMEVTADNYLAMTLVGSVDVEEGKPDDAIALCRQAVSCKPIFPEAHFFLGRALEAKGRTEEARAEYETALRLRPDFGAAHVMAGLLLAQEKEFERAIVHYQAALKSNPGSAAAQSDWGMALVNQGRWKESIAHYEEALRLEPDLEGAHNNLGIAYLQTGRVADGVRELRAALKFNSSDSETRFNLGQALNEQQQWAEAAELLQPLAGSQKADVQFQYGLALEHLGRTRDAVSRYEEALLRKPDFADALQHLAWIAATDGRPESRNGSQAVEMAARACALTGQKRPAMLLTLAAAYAEAGRFGEAVAAAGKAEELAKAQGQKDLGAQAARLRALFEAGQAYHGQPSP